MSQTSLAIMLMLLAAAGALLFSRRRVSGLERH
jgi:uncharacterized protein (TIGR03382 family)